MTRDHLMGYAPSAAVSADCPDAYDECAIWDHTNFPLGRPERVRQAYRECNERLQRKAAPIVEFERKAHANPDGSFTSMSGITYMTRSPRAVPHVDCGVTADNIGDAMKALWYHLGADKTPPSADRPQAVPLSQLVPPGLMVGGIAESTSPLWRNTGRATQAEAPPSIASVGVAKGGALSQVLQAMKTDPAFRARMTQRVQALNVELANAPRSKGDGGIALPEIVAGQELRFTAVSIPIQYETGFDFPPNA